ncbi:MAG TPA: glycosyltransferase [Candidatus Acidoferrales bacterium]|nr:glycosyltransferase [Candidatus Acidoferrales bacterium]
MPKVSVIVPNYNHARFLTKRIESILGQTFQDFELILLDDCSNDESRSILSRYSDEPRVKLQLNDANSGSTFRQWNKGARLARGEYVWMAESDDYADRRFLERLVAVLDTEPAAAFAYCRSWCVTSDDRVDGFGDWYLDVIDPKRWRSSFCVSGNAEFVNYLARCCVIPNASAVLFRRSEYLSAGGADEQLRVSGDWKLWAALALRGKVAFVDEPLNYYRTDEQSVLHRSVHDASNVIESLDVVRWILDQVSLSSEVLAQVYQARVDSWVPAVMSFHFSWSTKFAILKRAYAIDAQCARRILRPAWRTVQRKISRHWLCPKCVPANGSRELASVQQSAANEREHGG